MFISPSAAKVVQSRGIKVPAENISSDKGDIDIGGASPTIVRMTTVATAPQRMVLATTDHIRATTSSPAPTSRRRRT